MKTNRRRFLQTSAGVALTFFSSTAAGNDWSGNLQYGEVSRLKVRLFSVLCFLLLATTSVSAQSPAPATTTPDVPDVCAETKAQVVQLQNRLKDWPALGRYHDENLKVALPTKGERRVVFMGDSITDSWDNPKFGGFFPGQPYINRGISGQTTSQMLIRFRAEVIALKPRVVVILAGTNDIAGNTGPMSLEAIEDNLMSMAELARMARIRVVLSSVLPISDYDQTKEGKPLIRSSQRPPERIRALNDWMRKYAAETGAVYLDYYSAMIDDKGFLKEDLSEDGLHPNQKGYDIMAPLAERAINSALKRK
jgi:lysophospholipase L1-like esterase